MSPSATIRLNCVDMSAIERMFLVIVQLFYVMQVLLL